MSVQSGFASFHASRPLILFRDDERQHSLPLTYFQQTQEAAIQEAEEKVSEKICAPRLLRHAGGHLHQFKLLQTASVLRSGQ